jgi:hypothetical protein
MSYPVRGVPGRKRPSWTVLGMNRGSIHLVADEPAVNDSRAPQDPERHCTMLTQGPQAVQKQEKGPNLTYEKLLLVDKWPAAATGAIEVQVS